jgi:hypothetical protein
MMVRNHPRIVAWPPQPGGTNVTAEHPQAESQPIVMEVHVDSVRGNSVPLSCSFKGNVFTYDVLTKDATFAKKLSGEFSKHVGCRLEQLGNLEIDF